MSRLQQQESKGLEPSLPPAGLAAYLVGYLFDAGPVSYGATGAVPLSHAEIAAWQANTGTDLQAWEAMTLRRLSSAYIRAGNEAESPDCPPPYAELDVVDKRDQVAHVVGSIFGARTRKAH